MKRYIKSISSANKATAPKMPVVGDLMFSLETHRLAYCEGRRGGFILMTFAGDLVPYEYTKNEILTLFRY